MQTVPSQSFEPRNLILAALPDGELQVFRDQGQKVSVHEGKTLQTSGVPSEWLLFPTTAALSLMGATRDGLSVETGLVGQEGMVGLPQFFGYTVQTLECMAQHGGELWQISTSHPTADASYAATVAVQICQLSSDGVGPSGCL